MYSRQMAGTGPGEHETRAQLDKILASTGFARNDRLSRFLRFVVERHLENKDHELKEAVVAVEVFGRSPDFDPKRDPIVRTEAARLRSRLNEYYLNGGQGDCVVIELPKGGYVPVIRERESIPVAPAEVTGTPAVFAWMSGQRYIVASTA